MAIVEDHLRELPASEPTVEEEMAGLDALDAPADDERSRARRIWVSAWPKLLAIAIVGGVWQVVVWSGWRPEYVLPSPPTVLKRFFDDLGEATTWEAIANTMKRAATGYSLAAVIGTFIGLAVTRFKALRAAIGLWRDRPLAELADLSWFDDWARRRWRASRQ